MLSSELKQGHSYTFEVLKERSSRKFYRIMTEDGVELSLQKFKFQQKLPIPETINCFVKSVYPLSLGQDISFFIREFYSEGKDYEFKIKAIKKDSVQIYELEDDNELCFRLYNAPDSLTVGSRIKCKVIRISGVNVILKYVGTLTSKLPFAFMSMVEWLEALKLRPNDDIMFSLLENIPEFQSTLEKYDNRDPSWIFELLQTVSLHITDWLIACKDNMALLSKTARRMKLAKKLALYILEESEVLRNCDSEQRSMLQNKLSDYIEIFDQYEEATEIIFKGTFVDFMGRMVNHLKVSGFLYKPSKQFRIMRTIMRLRPELINDLMGDLFEALHNWELSNWQNDPFRGALVEQLEIFIKEYCPMVNQLPANDSAEDNRTIVRMVLAIAIQCILAKESDGIDMTLNRSMLYRYISFLNPGSVAALLDKSVEAILGATIPLEFTWNDTDHPTLLVMKSSHPAPYSEDTVSLVKTYTTSKASLQLRAGQIHLIAKDADPEATALPNNIVDWLNPKISIQDDIKTQNVRKSKDLRNLRNMWDDISWSIFGLDSTAGEVIEKRHPESGDEVRIVIDDIRILKTGPEKQRLQFHCTITDDLYIGEGWMPCDSFHMISWLTSKDIPGNYDGSLKFAHSESGTPLVFPASVKNTGSELKFSMKAQIDDYLFETSWPGKASVCIVTHFDRANNAWLCLSELGCTFKVPFEDSSADLKEGMLVRVKYVEPERSNSATQFFIGELDEDQENIPTVIKKSQCLVNLMRGLGKDFGINQAENSEVVEIEEVMSKEELIELIYMFQRRAHSETEYFKAFNYLGFATLLCRLAEEDQLLEELTTHMELLQLLQDFGKNQKIDMELLSACGEKAGKTPMLERIHSRLKIVAEFDSGENADWLWEIRNNPRNELEQRLASLVLSYNMIPPELDKSRKEIMKEVTTLLNVNSTTPTSKYYGDESQTVEFKSSMIFSSKSGGRADFRAQIHEIIHVICGFMNARGGTLYIGVNDSGYENGLDDDLAYRKAHGFKSTIDSMMVDLQNNLDRAMPPHARDRWEISSDNESKKGVIVVKVAPVEQPVEYEGTIFVRSSSTTKPRLGEEREEFIKNRSHNYRLLMKIWGVDESGVENESDEHEDPTSILPASKPESTSPLPSVQEATKEVVAPKEQQKIQTGRHRQNVLHSYENSFVQPAFYLYFGKGKLNVSAEDTYFDYEPECRLALVVKMKERNGMLVVTNTNGEVLKTDMSRLDELLQGDRSIDCNCDDISFVNIADENDYLLSIVQIPAGPVFYRLDPISSIENGNVGAGGKTLCINEHTILSQEIISSDKLGFFDKDSIGKESRFYGNSLPVYDGTLTISQRIERLLKPITHND